MASYTFKSTRTALKPQSPAFRSQLGAVHLAISRHCQFKPAGGVKGHCSLVGFGTPALPFQTLVNSYLHQEIRRSALPFLPKNSNMVFRTRFGSECQTTTRQGIQYTRVICTSASSPSSQNPSLSLWCCRRTRIELAMAAAVSRITLRIQN